MKKIILLSCIIILLPISVLASTINVPVDQPTIQDAIDASVDGDVILLANDIYTGAGNYNIDFNGRSITVKSSGGPENCIIDCQSLGRGFLLYSGEVVTLEGLTIKNGDAGEGNDGGAIYASGSNNIIVVDCTFTSNNAWTGGAVYSETISSFTNCTFTSNSAQIGGAVKSTAPSSFTNCTFTFNSAGSGGTVYSSGSSYFTNCTFTSNSATFGGAVESFSHSFFTSCIFTSNSASSGGAVKSPGYSSITNCTFTSNSATSSGGAIHYSSNYLSSITNCTFTSNSATSSGGAIYFTHSSKASINNCTFTLNEAIGEGDAIWCDIPMGLGDPITLKNCILWDNSTAIHEDDKSLVITYSNIQDGHYGTGNIDSDPLFVDAIDDLHLQENSPCINTGTADGAPVDDLDGNPRPAGNGFDMGAYEYQGPIVIDSFTASPTTGEPSLIVDFVCTAHDDSNAITGYQWNFGDGNTDTSVAGTIQHTYIIPGSFTATCTVANDDGYQTTASTIIEVTNDIPVADAGGDQIIPGNSVGLDGSGSSDHDGNIVSWSWALEHLENSTYDKNATGETPTVANLEYGNYVVTLTVTDNYGATGTDEMHLCVAASDAIYTQAEFDQNYTEGHTTGVAEGYTTGYAEGHTAGHSAGYTEGHTDGVVEGYTNGYSDGYTAGQNNCKQCPIREDTQGNKFLDGPLTIEDNGLLTIQ